MKDLERVFNVSPVVSRIPSDRKAKAPEQVRRCPGKDGACQAKLRQGNRSKLCATCTRAATAKKLGFCKEVAESFLSNRHTG